MGWCTSPSTQHRSTFYPPAIPSSVERCTLHSRTEPLPEYNPNLWTATFRLPGKDDKTGKMLIITFQSFFLTTPVSCYSILHSTTFQGGWATQPCVSLSTCFMKIENTSLDNNNKKRARRRYPLHDEDCPKWHQANWSRLIYERLLIKCLKGSMNTLMAS